MPECPDHGAPLPPACPGCELVLERDVETMTPNERADELAHWFDLVLTVDFYRLHKRIEQLVGRPVWTHEMGSPGYGWLIEEARTQEHPADPEAHAIGSLDQLAGTKPVIVARTGIKGP